MGMNHNCKSSRKKKHFFFKIVGKQMIEHCPPPTCDTIGFFWGFFFLTSKWLLTPLSRACPHLQSTTKGENISTYIFAMSGEAIPF